MDFDRLAKSYVGAPATGYDEARAKLVKWNSEQAIAEEFLGRLPSGSTLVDIPVGTGRFLEAYHRLGLRPTGMDVSPDMRRISKEKAEALGFDIPVVEGDLRKIAAPDASFDTAVCICFLNWVNTEGARLAFSELVRVARKNLLVSIRFYAPATEMGAGGLVQWPLQQAVRIQQIAPGRGLVLHEKSAVMDMFAGHGLRIVDSRRVVPRKYGTDYFIYLLEKP